MGGIIALDRQTDPPLGNYLAHGVAIASDLPDRSIEHLASVALEKRHQLLATAPGIVFAGFSDPVPSHISTDTRLHAKLAELIAGRWANHPEISGAGFLFTPKPSRDNFHQCRVVVHYFTNASSRFKLPPDFRWTI